MTNINLRAVNLAFSIPEILFEELKRIEQDIESPITVMYPEAELHLSLFMGLVEENRLKDLSVKLKTTIFPIEICGTGICYAESGRAGQTVVSYCFERNTLINELHENVFEIFREFATNMPAKSEMFYQKTAGESSLNYLSNFSSLHAGACFDPHITLGYASQKHNKKPDLVTNEFRFDEAHLYLLGDSCTCIQRIFRVL